jgi:hypothetical protein
MSTDLPGPSFQQLDWFIGRNSRRVAGIVDVLGIPEAAWSRDPSRTTARR